MSGHGRLWSNRHWPALVHDRPWPELVFLWYGRLWPRPTFAKPTLAETGLGQNQLWLNRLWPDRLCVCWLVVCVLCVVCSVVVCGVCGAVGACFRVRAGAGFRVWVLVSRLCLLCLAIRPTLLRRTRPMPCFPSLGVFSLNFGHFSWRPENLQRSLGPPRLALAPPSLTLCFPYTLKPPNPTPDPTPLFFVLLAKVQTENSKLKKKTEN